MRSIKIFYLRRNKRLVKIIGLEKWIDEDFFPMEQYSHIDPTIRSRRDVIDK